MKNLFYFLILVAISNVGYAQGTYELPLHKHIIDIPGDNFFVTYSEGTYVYIEEFSADNVLVWKDSIDHSHIPGETATTPANFGRHARFDDDKYVFSYHKFENGLNSELDTITTMFVKFSLSQQNILGQTTVRAPHRLFGGFVCYDSIIVMNFLERQQPNYIRKRIYYKLNEDLNFHQMEHSDTNDFNSLYFQASLSKDDTIYQYYSSSSYFSNSSWLRVEKYNSLFQLLTYTDIAPNNGGTDPRLIFKNNNPDSLLYFQSQNNKIYFKWLDMHLNTNLEKTINLPQYASVHGVVLIDDIIYVAVRQSDKVRIHKYNLLFNEICATYYVDETQGIQNSFSMLILNEIPYLRVERNYNDQKYTPITECEILSIEENNMLDFNVFPNPTEKDLVVEFSDGNTYELSMYSLQGQIVKKYGHFTNQAKLDVESFDSGIYFLKVVSGNRHSMVKIVKQ